MRPAAPTIPDCYMHASRMSAAGKHTALFQALPNDVAGLVRIVQGLLIHEFFTSAYGLTIANERRFESHLRPVEAILDRMIVLDPSPLSVARSPEKRVIGVCRHFALALVSMMRAAGIPARARCGFGNYFNPGYYEDHWVCEYWNAEAARWKLVDPQFDDKWCAALKITHDVLDVPRDRFLVAADAWRLCRSGQADAAKFGIFRGDLRGLWFVAGNLVRDSAALTGTEMLAWDVWGGMPQPGESLDDAAIAFFDRLAELTRDPDAAHDELCLLYESDQRLRVPSVVFNAVLERPEEV
ncbi:MAG TPA: transglutaminase-like domain-containing protein [Pirellulales bacterium]|nr:transglutaminase-like domain-containing protein [Pirellulales bacterium]